MNFRANKIARDTHTSSKQNDSSISETTKKRSDADASIQLENNRPEAIAYDQLSQLADNSSQVAQLQSRQDAANQHIASEQSPAQGEKNDTGLPDDLKAGIEHLSGYSMDDVNVHYNSAQPAQLQAQAYAQGTDIHLAPGKEQHLAHEAWHVVQQKQGRVQPTLQMKKGVNVNDDVHLEQEADTMGEKAVHSSSSNKLSLSSGVNNLGSVVQRIPEAKEMEDDKMFGYMREVGFGDKVPSKQEQVEILKEADRGEKLLSDIVHGKGEIARNESDTSYSHSKDIRAISWALYRKAHRKGQGFIGGMIVLEDKGRLFKYLSLGRKQGHSILEYEKQKMKGEQAVSYYERKSTHFGERRDMSYGMDFHGFYKKKDKGSGFEEDRSIKLPVQKSQLHFGTLDGGQRTFVKFEYYGTNTFKDVGLHLGELVKKNLNPEVGHREDVKGNIVSGIKKVLGDAGIPKKFHDEIVVGGKEFTAKKSGLYFGRLVINEKIVDPAKKAKAIEELHKVPEYQYVNLEDKKFEKKCKKVLKKASIPEAHHDKILKTREKEKEMAPEKWLQAVGLAISHIVKDETKTKAILDELQKVVEERFINLTDHVSLRQGDEVILTSKELMTAHDRARMHWGKLRGKSALLMRSIPSFGASYTPKGVPLGEETQSARGAFLANYVDNKERIGESSDYMGDRKDPQSAHHQHLKEFHEKGAYTFITPLIHKRISGTDEWVDFGGWGRDANFVTTESAVESLIKKHGEEGARGIFGLEEDLSVDEAQWVEQCAKDGFIMYLYMVDPKHLDTLNLRIPSGAESGAYGSWWKKNEKGKFEYVAGQWRPRGYTEGGQKEAVIDPFKRYDQDLFDQRNPFMGDMVKISVIEALRENTIKTIEKENRDPKTGKKR